MKKYIVNLMIVFVMQSCVAMELVKLSPEDDRKCFTVARYLSKYPEGKNQDEKNKIDLFFSSEKKDGLLSYASYLLFGNRENRDFQQTIDSYRNKIKNKESFLIVAVCKKLPFDLQKSIFDIIHQYMKKDFIDKTITAFEKKFQAEREYLAANINLAKDFKSRMRDDLLTLSKKPQGKGLIILSCSLYVDNPRWSPIQAINCTDVIGLFNRTEEEYQKFLNTLSTAKKDEDFNTLSTAKKDEDIVKLYIQFMAYLSSNKFLGYISCQEDIKQIRIYTIDTNFSY